MAIDSLILNIPSWIFKLRYTQQQLEDMFNNKKSATEYQGNFKLSVAVEKNQWVDIHSIGKFFQSSLLLNLTWQLPNPQNLNAPPPIGCLMFGGQSVWFTVFNNTITIVRESTPYPIES